MYRDRGVAFKCFLFKMFCLGTFPPQSHLFFSKFRPKAIKNTVKMSIINHSIRSKSTGDAFLAMQAHANPDR